MYIVDIRAVRDYKVVYKYLLKYIAKPPTFNELDHYVIYIRTIKGVRRLPRFGIMCGFKVFIKKGPLPYQNFLNAFDKKIQKDVILHSLGKMGIRKVGIVKDEKEISNYLYKRFRKDKAENLEIFIATVKDKGKEHARKYFRDISFKRYWNDCLKLGLLSMISDFDYYDNVIKSIDNPSLNYVNI